MKKNILNIVKTTALAYLFIILLVIMLALVWLGYIQSVGALVVLAIFTVVGTVTVIALVFKQLVKFIEDIKELYKMKIIHKSAWLVAIGLTIFNFINKLDGSGLTYMAVLKPVIIMVIFDVVVYGLVLLLALGIIIYEWYDNRKSKKL